MSNQVTQPNVGDQISPDGLPIQQPDKVVAPAPAPSTPDHLEPFNGQDAANRGAAIKDEDTVDVTAFLEAGGTAAKKVDEPAAKPDATKSAEPTAKPAAEPAAKPAQPNARDYTGIPDTMKPLFERMSNEAFAEMTKLHKEHEALKTAKQQADEALQAAKKGALPDSYYEHEDAYMLTPEFANASIDVRNNEIIANHWRTQLRNLAEGAETWQDLNWDQQKQQFVLSAPQKAERTTELSLQEYYNWAQQQVMTKRAELNALGTAHKNKTAEAKNWLADWQTKAFAIFNDDTKPFKAMVADTKNKVLPAAFRNNPLAEPLTKALITLQLMAQAQKQQQGGATTTGTQGGAQPAAPAAKANKQPTGAEIAGGGVAPTARNGAEEEVSLDDFNAVKFGAR